MISGLQRKGIPFASESVCHDPKYKFISLRSQFAIIALAFTVAVKQFYIYMIQLLHPLLELFYYSFGNDGIFLRKKIKTECKKKTCLS